MPRPIPAYPAPVATARFTHDDEDWRIATQPPAEAPLSPDWQPEAGIGHRPNGTENDWSFVAPAAFRTAMAGCPDGILVLVLGLGVTGSTLRPAADNVVAVSGGTALGFDTSAPDAHEISPDGRVEIRIPLSPGAGWIDLATGQPATTAQVTQVLAGLEQLTIRGLCALTPLGALLPVRLRAADIHADPRLLLELPVEPSYVDGALYATWPASPYAGLYRVEVYGWGVREPIVTLVGPSFAGKPYLVLNDLHPPPEGALYYVQVAVVGMTAPQEITAIPLARPQLAVTTRGRSATFTWAAMAEGATYELRVESADGVVVTVPAITAPATTLGEADGLQCGRDYTAKLRAVVGRSTGPWSEAMPFRLSSAADILAQLRDRLTAHPPGAGQVAFAAATLPADRPGEPSRVLDRLTAALGLTGDMRITLSGELELSDELLKVTGRADLPDMGMRAARVVAQFVVSDALMLDMTMSIQPGENWRLSHAFGDLYGTELDAVRLASPTLFFTTFVHRRITVPGQLSEGLNLAANFEYTAGLMPVTATTPPQDVRQVQVGGTITRKGKWVELSLAAVEPLVPLTARPLNRPAIGLRDGALTLTRVVADDAATDSLRIEGIATIRGQDVRACLDVPNTFKGERLLTVNAGALAADRFSTLLGDLSTDEELPPYFPDSLLTLAGLTTADFGFAFDPAGGEATTAFVTVTSAGPWGFADTLSVSGIRLEVVVLTRPDEDGALLTSVEGALTGTIALGQNASYTATLGITGDDHWYLVIHDDNRTPAMGVLANFLGIGEDRLWPAMPDSLKSLCSISLTDVFLGGNPFTGRLDTVGFRLEQTREWTAAGKLTVKDWSIAVTVAKQADGWNPIALLQGKITVGEGRDAVTAGIRMPIPPAPGTPWEVALEDDSVVHIPTIRQLVAMSGRDSAPLPDGIATLGGLDVDRLSVGFEVSPPAIRYASFAIATTQPWVIIRDGLHVTDVKAAFSVRNPKEGDVAAMGAADGTIELMGTPVHVSLFKGSYESEWVLTAATGPGIHIPGYAQLANWLAPDNVRWYMPPNLPLAKGFDVSDVTIAFGGGSGTLNAVGFRLTAEDAWPVIPGKLELESIRAELTIPYPVSAERISGQVAGLVQILDAHILLSATKPGAGQPWEFRGTLTEAVTIDLVQAASDLSSRTFVLPTGIGLPSAVTIERAAVLSVPDTGRFHFDGAATFQDWKASLGAAEFQIHAVRGSMDVERKDADLKAMLGGSLTFASLAVDVALQLGTGAVDTVLAGTLSAADAGRLKLPDLTDGIAVGATTPGAAWAQVVPQDMAALPLSSASVAINFTKKVFALSGRLKDYASAFLVCRKGDGEDAGWEYTFAGRMGEGFSFARIIPALSAADEVVRVKDARLMVYGVGTGGLDGMKRAVATLAVADAPQGAYEWPLPATLPQDLPAERGVVFAAQLDLTLSPLFGKVLEIGTANADGTATAAIGMLAVIDRQELNNSAFAATFPTLTLFSTVELSELAATYRPKLNKQLTLAARLTIKQVFGQDYAFLGRLLLDSTQAKGTIDLATSADQKQSVDQPFGVPGITLTKLQAEAIIAFAVPATDTAPAKPRSTRLAMLGSVRLGSGEAAQTITGVLALADGAPVLARLQLDSTLSVAQFFAQCLKDHATWPGTFVDIKFLRDSCIYYYDKQADKNGLFRDYDRKDDTLPDGRMRQHQDGFNIDARVQLMFYKSLDLRFTLNVPRDANRKFQGVRASASPDRPLDMGFIQIAGPNKQTADKVTAYVGGPELYLDTVDSQPKFGFRGGLNFFGGALLGADISVSRDDAKNTVVAGDLKGTVAPFGDLSVGFTYTVKEPENELRFRDWPNFTWVKTVVNLVNELRKLYNLRGAGRCGALVAMAKEVLAPDTSYSIKPDVRSDGGDLVFSFTGVVTVSLQSTKLFDLDMPPLDIRVPMSTKLDDLPGVLATALEAGGQDLVLKLLASPEKTGLLLAVLFGPDAVAAALELICNSTASEATATATAAAGGSLTAAGVGAGGIGAGGIGGGGAAAVAAVAAALGTAVLAVAAIGGGGSPGGGGGTGGDQDATPGKPKMLSLAFDKDNGFVGTWTAAAYTSFYEFEMAGPDYAPPAKNVGRSLRGSMAADPAALKPGTYTGRARADAGNGKSTASDGLTVTKPGPIAVALSYADGVLKAECGDLGPQYLYDVDFQCLDGASPGIASSAAGIRQVSTALPQGAGRRYVARARGRADTQIPGDWGTEAHIDLLAQPAGVTVTQQGRDARITWQAVDGAAGYAVRVVGAAAPQAAAERSDLAADATACTLSLPDAAAGTSYRVQVRATAANQAGDWSAEIPLTCLPVPAPAAVAYDGATGQITARWDAIEGAGIAYEAELRNADAQVLGPMAVAPDAPAATSTGYTLQDGAVYQVAVRVAKDGAKGDWSTTASVRVRVIAVPGGIALSFDGDTFFRLTWNAEDGLHYDARMTLPDGQPFGPDHTDLPGGETVFGDRLLLPPPGLYAAQMRGRDDAAGAVGPWSPPIPVSVLPSPEGMALSYQNDAVLQGVLTAQWQPVAEAGTHEFELRDPDGNSLCTRVGLVPDADGLVRVDVRTQDMGDYFATNGTVVAARARAVLPPGSRSRWSDDHQPNARIDMRPLPMAGNLTLTREGNTLRARWAGSAPNWLAVLDIEGATSALGKGTTGNDIVFTSEDGLVLRAGTTYTVAVWAWEDRSRGAMARAATMMAAPLPYAREEHAANVAAEETGRRLSALVPGMPPVEILATLAAAGYGRDDATGAVHRLYPVVAASDVADMVMAVFDGDIKRLALALGGAAVPAGRAVPLVAALSGDVPAIRVAAAMRAGLYTDADAKAALIAHYPALPADKAAAMVTALWHTPWTLGPALRDQGVTSAAEMAETLRSTFPLMSPVEGAVVMQSAGIDAMLAAPPLRNWRPGVTPDELADVMMAVFGDFCDRLAVLLLAGGLPPDQAFAWIMAAYPDLAEEKARYLLDLAQRQ